MEITKEQIEEIDQLLKKRGIKYWDLRIEMVDHIVFDIELNATTCDFKIELDNSLNRIGWWGNLGQVNRNGWKETNKRYRKMFHTETVLFFKSFKNVLILFLLFGLYYSISEFLEFKSFVRLNVFLLLTPVAFTIYQAITKLVKGYGRSVNLDYGITYLMLSFFILQGIPNLFDNHSESTQKLVWLLVIPIYFVTTFSGYKVYKAALYKVENMRKELSL